MIAATLTSTTIDYRTSNELFIVVILMPTYQCCSGRTNVTQWDNPEMKANGNSVNVIVRLGFKHKMTVKGAVYSV